MSDQNEFQQKNEKNTTDKRFLEDSFDLEQFKNNIGKQQSDSSKKGYEKLIRFLMALIVVLSVSLLYVLYVIISSYFG